MWFEIFNKWFRKEVKIVTILISLISLIAILESIGLSGKTQTNNPNNYPIFAIFFGELLLISVTFFVINFFKTVQSEVKFRYPVRLYWILAITNGLLLIYFNDYWGENELFLIFVFFYFPVLLFFVIRWLFREIRVIINLKNEKAKTELMHLQNQVNPHFFFNMLNSLYGWTGKDPVRAQELILQLSDIMRYSIYEGQKERVTIKEEADYLEKYMKLHQTRYVKDISIDFAYDVENDALEITPLLFIILVENAFKHGVESLRENAFVKINLSSTETEITFNISNNFDRDKPLTDSGIGLKNLQRRLTLIYPEKHSFKYGKEEDVFMAQLKITLS
ncbi:MAG: histidine kinase [Bacteroidota bacterium]